jgi:hypothetical protein
VLIVNNVTKGHIITCILVTWAVTLKRVGCSLRPLTTEEYSGTKSMYLTASNFREILQALCVVLPAKLNNFHRHGQLTASKTLHQLCKIFTELFYITLWVTNVHELLLAEISVIISSSECIKTSSGSSSALGMNTKTEHSLCYFGTHHGAVKLTNCLRLIIIPTTILRGKESQEIILTLVSSTITTNLAEAASTIYIEMHHQNPQVQNFTDRYMR